MGRLAIINERRDQKLPYLHGASPDLQVWFVPNSEGRTRRKVMSSEISARSGQRWKHHGMSSSPTYYTWKGMVQRCHNPKDPSFARYGALGIRVCERWKVFANFLADMGERPAGTTLDRRDVKGNYEPSNCRWASREVQSNNKRNTKRFEYQGESLTIAQWANRYGINPITLETRLNRHNWPIEKALTKPIKPRGARTWQPSL